jgi:hypothetical protein
MNDGPSPARPHGGNRIRRILLALLAALAAAGPALADENRAVAPGVTFRALERPGPLRVFVVEADLTKADADLALAGGDVPGLAKVSAIVKETEARGRKALAAVNGDYCAPLNAPLGAVILSGEVAATSTRPRWDTFFLGADGKALIAPADARATAVLPRPGPNSPAKPAAPLPLEINREPEGDGLVLFTRRFGRTTPPAGNAAEAVLAGDDFPLEEDETLKARVESVSDAAGKGTPIPERGAVLAGRGNSADLVRALKPGGVVTLAFNQPGVTRARFATGGVPAIVRGGKPLSEADMAKRPMKEGFIRAKHPRTAIGWAKGKLVLVVVDGRSKESLGIDLPALADLMVSLGCTEAMNLDGGGSTTMWVSGAGVVNTPSDRDKEGNPVERPRGSAVVILIRP